MNQFKIVFVIIATLIGAGFASGQEIYFFFYRYGVLGIAGLVLCICLLASIVYKVFLICLRNNIDNYKDFLILLFGKFGILINIIVNLFLLITFYIMIAGFGAYFLQEAGISDYIGCGIITLLCFLTFMTNTNSVLKINTILIPTLIFCILLISIINFKSLDNNDITKLFNPSTYNTFSCFKSSVLYFSYNSILLVPTLITMKKNITNRKTIIVIALLSSYILLLLSLSIFFMLTKIKTNISSLDMPIIYVIRNYYKIFIHIYSFVILSSIYTTAISIGMSFIENICKISKKRASYPQIVLIMCITGFMFSHFGFTNIIVKLYPFFGYLGLIQVATIFLFFSSSYIPYNNSHKNN